MKTNLSVDGGEFRITAHGFNMIKRELGYSGSAKSFAESYGFKYENLRITGTDNKGWGIVGHIPDSKEPPDDSSDRNMD